MKPQEVTSPEEAAPAADIPAQEQVNEQFVQPQDALAETQVATPAEEQQVDWERRYNAANGRLKHIAAQHNAFETDAQSVIEKANAEVIKLRAELASARAQLKEMESLKPPPPTPEAMIDQLGQDAADATWQSTWNAMKAQQEGQSPVTPGTSSPASSPDLTEQPAPYQPPASSSYNDRQLEVVGYLDNNMIDWEATLGKDEFKAWTRNVNPATNRKYSDEFEEANTAYDAQGLLRVFQAYKQAKGTHRPPAESIIPVAPGGTGTPTVKSVEIPPMTDSRYKHLCARAGMGNKQAQQELANYRAAVKQANAQRQAS